MKQPSIRPPRMYSGLQRRKSAHQLYLKMSYLELEKTRRCKELEAMSRRMQMLEERMQELDGEIAQTQAEINEHPDGVSPEALEEARRSLYSSPGQHPGASRSRSPFDRDRDEPPPPSAPGLMIKY